MNDLPTLHKLPAVAVTLGLSVRNVQRLIKWQLLRAVHFGRKTIRVHDEALQACLRSGLHKTTPGEHRLNVARQRATARLARRRAAKLKRIPAWWDREKVASIYAQARRLTLETGIIHHVDHVVPLQGLMVSGLHVHQNLQILSAVENQSKGRRWP